MIYKLFELDDINQNINTKLLPEINLKRKSLTKL